MSPILGIWASAKPGAPATSFESIATVTVGSGGASNVDFTNIPGTYSHLQIRCYAQTNRATFGIDEIRIRFNSDTGSNYAVHNLYGNGSSATDSGQSSVTGMVTSGTIGTNTGNSGLVWGIDIVDVLDYANTNKFTTIRRLTGVDLNGTVGGSGGRVGLSSGLWQNTNAVTSINITPVNGSLITQYSHFALYGIKVAS